MSVSGWGKYRDFKAVGVSRIGGSTHSKAWVDPVSLGSGSALLPADNSAHGVLAKITPATAGLWEGGAVTPALALLLPPCLICG